MVRSFRATAGFLLLTGCFDFIGLCFFWFCGYDLLVLPYEPAGQDFSERSPAPPIPHDLSLLRDGLIEAPPLGFFFVVRSFRATAGFLLLAGCFDFMGLYVFWFCGDDLLTNLWWEPRKRRSAYKTDASRGWTFD